MRTGVESRRVLVDTSAFGALADRRIAVMACPGTQVVLAFDEHFDQHGSERLAP